MTPSLEELHAEGAISSLDGHFARSMSRTSGDERPEVLLAAALASRQMAQGDVCVDLRQLAAEPADAFSWPAIDGWLEVLASSPLVAPAERASENTPLVLDQHGRLYLRRLFEAEEQVAKDLAGRADGLELRDVDATRASIERLLPATDADARDIHWPRVAASIAVAKKLCVISGHPGTGKTTTAARLLAVLVESALSRPGADAPRIALAAPTGKAAARLAQAIGAQVRELACDDAVRAAIPDRAGTLHRLLGIDGQGRVRWGGRRQLQADIVLVDEASMVDLALMSRLIAALPESARLILLGDADQLASVEAGSVFADLCGPRRAPEYGSDMASWAAATTGQAPWVSQSDVPAISDCVVRLTRSYRYEESSGIGDLSRAIQAGDANTTLALLDDPSRTDVSRVAPDADAIRRLQAAVVDGYASFCEATELSGRLEALGRFRLLCAVRDGRFGVDALARLADQTLERVGKLVLRGRTPARAAEGRPILVTRNAPHLGLYNGDVGILARAPGSTGVRAFFEDPSGELRSFAASRVPSYELVFAMSVHKSQGSEFDEVALVLPEQPLPLLTRELVYTAVTRARRRVVIYGSAEVLRIAISRRVERASGLRDRLWGRV